MQLKFTMISSFLMMSLNLVASEQNSQQSPSHQQAQVVKTDDQKKIEERRETIVHNNHYTNGCVESVYADGRSVTDFNDGSGTVLIEYPNGLQIWTSRHR